MFAQVSMKFTVVVIIVAFCILCLVLWATFIEGFQWEQECNEAMRETKHLRGKLENVEARLSKAQNELRRAKDDDTKLQKQLKENRLRLRASVEECKTLRGRLDRSQVDFKNKLDELEKEFADEIETYQTLISRQADELKTLKTTVSSQTDKLITNKAAISVQLQELEVAKKNLVDQASQISAANRSLAAQAKELTAARASIHCQAQNFASLHRELHFQQMLCEAWKEMHMVTVKTLQNRIREREREMGEMGARIRVLEGALWELGGWKEEVEGARKQCEEGECVHEEGEEKKREEGKEEVECKKDAEEETDHEDDTLVNDEVEENDFKDNTQGSCGERDCWDQGRDRDNTYEGDNAWVSENEEEEEDEQAATRWFEGSDGQQAEWVDSLIGEEKWEDTFWVDDD